jgi:hypothetical protein
MLFGNPDEFSIWFDPVEQWSTERFKNGGFSYFIGGKLFWSLGSTIGDDISLLSVTNCMKHDVEDSRLFNLPVIDAYVELCAAAFPSMDSDAEDSDYRHLISVGSLLDDGHNVFLVESGEEARLIYGFNEDASSVFDIFLKRGEVQSIIRKAVEGWRAR